MQTVTNAAAARKALARAKAKCPLCNPGTVRLTKRQEIQPHLIITEKMCPEHRAEARDRIRAAAVPVPAEARCGVCGTDSVRLTPAEESDPTVRVKARLCRHCRREAREDRRDDAAPAFRPACCPDCGSGDIREEAAGSRRARTVTVVMECEDCGSTWGDHVAR